MNKQAIIDIGSLKVKFSVFDTDKKELLLATSYLTVLGKGISEKHSIQADSLQKLDDALQKISQTLIQQKIESVIIIGTEALRRADNEQEVQKLIIRHLPGHTLEIIDQATEAELFFSAVSREFKDRDMLSMDIGGGSVQLIFGKYDSNKKAVQIAHKYNFSTGTYRLQQQYSPDNQIISSLFADAQDVVRKAYADITHTAPLLVFGSTCMLDFIQSSTVPVVGEQFKKHPVSVKQHVLEQLLQDLRKLPPSQRDHFYPEGGYFMYGADYLLLNVLEAIKVIKPKKILPTNLNSSYGFF